MKKISNYFIKYHNKLSSLMIIIYILLPLFLIYNNYENVTSKYVNLWYDLTFIMGCISAVVGIINLLFNIRKIDFKKMLPFTLIFIFLMLAFIAAYISSDKKIAFEGEWYRGVGYYTYLLFLGFYLNAINVPKKDYKIIATIFAIVSTVISIISLLNNEFTHKVFIWNKRPYNGIFMNSNHFGYYLSISVIVMIFLTIYEKNIIKKIIYYIMMSISFIMIISNDTFGSYLGVLMGLIFVLTYSIIKKKNFELILVTLLFFILSLIISTSNGSIVKNNFNQLFFDVKVIKNSNDKKIVDQTGTSRMKLWKYTYKIIKKNPWFGVGPNVVSKIYLKDGIRQGVPHNFILEVAAYNGIPALIIYLILLAYTFFKNTFKLDKYNIVLLTCMVSYLTSAFFGNMFFNTSPYFVIIMGMLSSNIILKDEKDVDI